MVGPKYLKSNKVSNNVGYLVYLLLNSPNLLNKSRLQRNRRLVRAQVPLVEQTSMEKKETIQEYFDQITGRHQCLNWTFKGGEHCRCQGELRKSFICLTGFV